VAARVLIADDDVDIAHAVEVNLQLEGYDVRVVGDGVAALEQARVWRPHVVLLDVVMPGRDGFTVARQLRADPSTQSCAVIFLTAKGAAGDEFEGRRTGAVDYIVKPFEPTDLLRRVRAAVATDHGS
jgi:DNA-binding response OmpR family regulator